jgi:hypothetical protein
MSTSEPLDPAAIMAEHRKVGGDGMTRTVDYTRKYWGHDLSIKQGQDGLLRGFCWSSPGVRVGDQLIWRTAYGTAVGEIIECRWSIDPDDMFQITVKVRDRQTLPSSDEIAKGQE